MQITVSKTAEELGVAAARKIAQCLREAIDQKGRARIVVSTGASQFTTIQALLAEDVDWSRVTLFHLDEYIGLPETHPASFRKYIRERLLNKAPFESAVLVDGNKPLDQLLPELNALLRAAPIDVGVIGIGENAHIAFNDPPADFDTRDAYICVQLDDRCRTQQVNEKWFAQISDVPQRAVSMTCYQIMQCERIISPVPYGAKAQAVKQTLESPTVTNLIPATILKTHKDYHLFLDGDSAALTDAAVLEKYA